MKAKRVGQVLLAAVLVIGSTGLGCWVYDLYQLEKRREQMLVLQQGRVYVVLHLTSRKAHSEEYARPESALHVLERSGFTTLVDPREGVKRMFSDKGATECAFVAPTSRGVISGSCISPEVVSPFCVLRSTDNNYQDLAMQLSACLFSEPKLALRGR